MWVPGHKCVSGNELAANEAKTAATSDPSNPIHMNFRVPSFGVILDFVVCQNVLCHTNWSWVWFIKRNKSRSIFCLVFFNKPIYLHYICYSPLLGRRFPLPVCQSAFPRPIFEAGVFDHTFSGLTTMLQ